MFLIINLFKIVIKINGSNVFKKCFFKIGLIKKFF